MNEQLTIFDQPIETNPRPVVIAPPQRKTYVLRDYQKAASNAAVNFFTGKLGDGNALIVCPTGCHAKGYEVLMYDGTLRKVEDVRVGDLLMGDDSTPRTVLDLHRGIDDMFRITPIKGEPFVVNGGHILSLYKTNEGKPQPSCTPRVDEISVHDYILTSANYKHLHKLYHAKQLDFGKKYELPLPPYFLGVYIGDGGSSNGSVGITTQRAEVASAMEKVAHLYGLNIRIAKKNHGLNKAVTLFFSGSKKKKNIIAQKLEEIGLFRKISGEKFIPYLYKTASYADRMELLAGLLDTDAFYNKECNTFEYSTKSYQLARDMQFLCRSLGYHCGHSVKVVNGTTYYRMQISGDFSKVNCRTGIRTGRERLQKKSLYVTGFSVEPIGKGEYYGFTLDGNHLYCDWQLFVHHNSGKSLIIADIATRLEGKLLVFQPSKEILEQNFAKYRSYGFYDCAIYSASMNSKKRARVTFATIGSVMSHPELFDAYEHIIVDECFPYAQQISTELGSRKIGTLYNWYKEGRKLPLVMSYNEETEKFEPKEIVSVAHTGRKEIGSVKCNQGAVIATPNHPILTNRGWVELCALKRGDAILAMRASGRYLPIPNSDQIDFLLGSIVGDGSVDKTRKSKDVNRFRFVQGKKQEGYLRWKAKMLNCEDKVTSTSGIGYKGDVLYRFTSQVMYFKDEMATKRYAIENLTPKSLAVIYMDDGHKDNQRETSGTICCVAESKELTELLATKLNAWGIDCVASQSKSSETKRIYNYIRIRKNGILRISEICAPYTHKDLAYKIHSDYRYLVGSYKWDCRYLEHGALVVQGEYEKTDIQDVYNIEVKDNHTYVLASGTYNKAEKTYTNGIVVHNCHLTNAKGGRYKDFFEMGDRRILGLTATPYRLVSYEQGCILKFLTRTRPRIFSKLIYQVPIQTLMSRGYLARLRYFDMQLIDVSGVKRNSTGQDYDEASLRRAYEMQDLNGKLVEVVNRLRAPKDGSKRHGILVFTRFIEESEWLVKQLGSCAEIVTGDTPKKERERILKDFKNGKIEVVANVGVLVTGYDYPELDTIVMARPTMSLAMYYQIVGRGIRPSEGKNGWFVDMCGNVGRFGKVDDLELMEETPGRGTWCVYGRVSGERKQLTNIFF